MAVNVNIKSKNKSISLQRVMLGDKTVYTPVFEKIDNIKQISDTIRNRTFIYNESINDDKDITDPLVGQIAYVDEKVSEATVNTDLFNATLLNLDEIKKAPWWDDSTTVYPIYTLDNHNVYEDANAKDYNGGFDFYPINGQGATFNDLISVARWQNALLLTVDDKRGILYESAPTYFGPSHGFCCSIASKYELLSNSIIDYNEPITHKRLCNIKTNLQNNTELPLKYIDYFVIPIYAKYYYNYNLYSLLSYVTANNEDIRTVALDGSTGIHTYEVPPRTTGIQLTYTPFAYDPNNYVAVYIKPYYLEYYQANENKPIPLNHLKFNFGMVLHSMSNYLYFNTGIINSSIKTTFEDAGILTTTNCIIIADSLTETDPKKCLFVIVEENTIKKLYANTAYNMIRCYRSIVKCSDLLHYCHAIRSYDAGDDSIRFVQSSAPTNVADFIKQLISQTYGEPFSAYSSVYGYIIGYATVNASGTNCIYPFHLEPYLCNSLTTSNRLYIAQILPYNNQVDNKILKESPYTDILLSTMSNNDLVEPLYKEFSDITYTVKNINNTKNNTGDLIAIQGYCTIYNTNSNKPSVYMRIYWVSKLPNNTTSDIMYQITLNLPNDNKKTFYLIHKSLHYNIRIYYDITHTSDNNPITNLQYFLLFINNTSITTARMSFPYYMKDDNTVCPLIRYGLDLPILDKNNQKLVYNLTYTLDYNYDKYDDVNHNDTNTLDMHNTPIIYIGDNNQPVRVMEYRILIPNGSASANLLKEQNWCLSFTVQYDNDINGKYNDTTLKIPLNELQLVSNPELYITNLADTLCYSVEGNNLDLTNKEIYASKIYTGEDEVYEKFKFMVAESNMNISKESINNNIVQYKNTLMNLISDNTQSNHLYTMTSSFSKLLYSEDNSLDYMTVLFNIHLDYIEKSDNELIAVIN